MPNYVLWSRVLGHDRKDKITITRIWVSTLGWLGSSLETGTGTWSVGVFLPNISLGRCFRDLYLGEDPRAKPRTTSPDYSSWLDLAAPWDLPLEEMVEVAVERSVWASLLRLLAPPPRYNKTSNVHQHIHAGLRHSCIICSGNMCALSYAGRRSGLVPKQVLVGLTHTQAMLFLWPQTHWDTHISAGGHKWKVEINISPGHGRKQCFPCQKCNWFTEYEINSIVLESWFRKVWFFCILTKLIKRKVDPG